MKKPTAEYPTAEVLDALRFRNIFFSGFVAGTIVTLAVVIGFF